MLEIDWETGQRVKQRGTESTGQRDSDGPRRVWIGCGWPGGFWKEKEMKNQNQSWYTTSSSRYRLGHTCSLNKKSKKKATFNEFFFRLFCIK